MTIKPVIAPSQKRVASDEKKESHSHGHALASHSHTHGHNVVEPGSSHSQSSGRTTGAHPPCRGGQSPQRRAESFDEITRHRRSPHKSSRSKRRDHHDQHHKRERAEREKHSTASGSNSSIPKKCSSPHVHGGGSVATSAVGSPVGKNVLGGGSSPAHVSAKGSVSPDHLGAIPVVLGCQSPKSSSSVTQATANLLKDVEETYSGYNSGDEHLQPKEGSTTADEWQQRDEQFAKCMAQRGYELRPVEEDGACLFRSISLQIYGDEEMHDVVRQHTMDYIYKNREYFSHFVTEDINSYIKRKRRKDSHGNHIEIQAMSEIYNRPVEVYSYKPTPINIFNSEQLNKGYAPLRLSYQRGSHYNAIIDPYDASVGVGLGLAGYKPELQTKEAVLLSEQMEIEQTMFEDKLKTTDWEATNEAIEEQIARESYLQWCRENLQKTRSSGTAPSTSATVTSAEATSDSEASPSKYSALRNNNGNISTSNTNNSSCSRNINHTDVGGLTNTATTENVCEHKLSGIVGSGQLPNNTETSSGTSLEHSFGLSAKSLSSLANNLKKSSTPPHSVGEWDADSDDTDMSSTSSIGASSGSNNSGGKKNTKKRSSGLRTGGQKRRRETVAPSKFKGDAMPTRGIGKSLNHEMTGDSPLLRIKSRSHTPEAEQKPSTSKKTHPTTPEKGLNFSDTLSASTSKCTLASSSSSPLKLTESINKQESTDFYQELLEASYAGDGFGQLSESEMLQRAIQLSTHDYIEEQKRKFLFGP
ncbi:PREDICTED: OTU domain-containing protein 5-A [Rhagoletis zephyria]|uniref:OTU domain-containing protein 5-A n=1 Tax=Rhagoletis zephyria TaxID=28612 RepID=UPI000811826A|nr:PREDICTED: OTU domain-containing protein 5-A [Rhagoletis zephyria]XP_017479767.1 PREDICTED: OTU domain-containing protein 5-A [Rhagoletis zephyria]XP_017479768.1 PREDICTED: OTU domain-containing protein 5-A [Rhagoletis zephyria]